MDIKEITSKGTDSLKRDLAHLREELRELRFKISQNQHKDVRDIREKKHTIARILMELTKRTNKKS